MVKMYDAKPETVAKQHDLIRLWHVNPAQSKEVNWYRSGTTVRTEKIEKNLITI